MEDKNTPSFTDTVGDTIIHTSFEELTREKEEQLLLSALRGYDITRAQYSPYSAESSTERDLTLDTIDDLAKNINSSLSNVLSANAIIRKQINTNNIIGKTFEAIWSNINSDYRLNYPTVDGRNKKKIVDRAKSIIDDFNAQVQIEQFIRESISLTYAEGNYITALRISDGMYSLDHYPLGIAYVSDYKLGNKPVICIDLKELEKRLKKTYSKDKKNKAIFFENIERDIQANYPPEVYQAYKNKESVVRLDPRFCKIMRIGNMGRRYGVSPFFRALQDVIVMNNLKKADDITSRAKQKKIIHQILRKEVLGPQGDRRGLTETAYAHTQLMAAWGNKTVVVTTPPTVEKIVYVEPSVDDTSQNKMKEYTSSAMQSLGIGFASDASSVGVARLSVEQLMRTINSISEQSESILYDFYREVLASQGVDPEYAPNITIIDSEQLSADVKQSLASFLYGTLNCSLETALETVGVDIENERIRREGENEAKIEEIFFPRASTYTTPGGGGGGVGGRPVTDNDPDKTNYDQQRYQDLKNI